MKNSTEKNTNKICWEIIPKEKRWRNERGRERRFRYRSESWKVKLRRREYLGGIFGTWRSEEDAVLKKEMDRKWSPLPSSIMIAKRLSN